MAMDLTPRPSTLSWSIFELLECCRPPAASPSPASLSSSDVAERGRLIDEEDATNSAGILVKTITKDGEKTVHPRMAVRFSAEEQWTSEENCPLGAQHNGGKTERGEEEELRSKVELLEADLLRFKRENAAKATEVVSLQKNLENVEKSLVGISKNRDDLLKEKGLMQAEREELTVAKDSMQEEVESLLKNVAKITVENAAEVEVMRRDLEAAKTKMDEQSAAKIAYLERELSGTRSSLVDTSTVRDELAAETDSLHRQVRNLQSDISKISSDRELEVGNLQMELELAQEQLCEAQKKILDVSSERNLMRGDISTMSSENECLLAENHTLLEQLNDEKKAAGRVQEELSSRIKLIEADLIQSKEMFSAKSLDVENLQKCLACVEKEAMEKAISVKKAAGQAQDELRCKVDSLESALLQSHGDATAKSFEVESLRGELCAVQKTLDDALMSRDKLVAENQNMREDLLTISSERDILSASKESIQKEMGDISSANDDLSTRQESMKKEILSILSERDAALAEKSLLLNKVAEMTVGKRKEDENIQREVEALTKERNEFSERVSAKEQEIENLRRQFEFAQAQLHEAEGKTKLLSNDLGALQSGMKDADDSIETLSMQLNAAEEEICKLKDDLIATDTEHCKLNEDLTARLDEVTNQKDSLAKQLAKKDSMQNMSEKEYLQLQVESLMNDVEEISITKRNEIETLQSENNCLQQKITSLLAEVAEITSATLSAQLHAANTDRDQIEMIIANRFDEAMKQKDAELRDAKKAACEAQEQLSSKVTSLEIDLLESKEDAAAKMSMVESLQKELKSKFTSLDIGDASDQQSGNLTPISTLAKSNTLRSSSENLIGRLAATPPAPAPSTPPICTSSKSDTMAMSLSSSVMNNSNAPSSISTDVYPCRHAVNGSATSAITVEGFSHQGLTVEFKCIKADPNWQKSLIIARFINCTNAPLSGLHLKVAVPKFVTMKLKPPTSTTVPVAGANSTKDVTQTISITNTMLGKKNLVLKIKASFFSNGTEVEHLATCAGFPAGQF